MTLRPDEPGQVSELVQNHDPFLKVVGYLACLTPQWPNLNFAVAYFENRDTFRHPAVGLRMAEYRAYVVGRDGHFVGFEGFACRDDGEAIAKAKRRVADHDVELWSGTRFVIKAG
jgi:hypothetical protein